MESSKIKIMGTDSHQIIYGTLETRKEIFQLLDREYQIKANNNMPMLLYIDDLSLPRIEYCGLNESKLIMLACECLKFSIAEKVITNINCQLDLNEISERLVNYLLDIGSYNTCKLNNLSELIDLLNTTKLFFIEYYSQYVKNGKTNLNFDDLKMPYMDIESFIRQIRKLINNKSYFAVVLDNPKPICSTMQKAIFRLINNKINGKISLKLAVTKEIWNEYYKGSLIEKNIQSFEKINLDDGYQKVLKY